VREQLDNKGLAYWNIKGIHSAKKHTQNDNLPDLDYAGKHSGSKERSLKHGEGLGNNQQSPTVPPISQHPCHRSEQKGRNLTGKTDYS